MQRAMGFRVLERSLTSISCFFSVLELSGFRVLERSLTSTSCFFSILIRPYRTRREKIKYLVVFGVLETIKVEKETLDRGESNKELNKILFSKIREEFPKT